MSDTSVTPAPSPKEVPCNAAGKPFFPDTLLLMACPQCMEARLWPLNCGHNYVEWFAQEYTRASATTPQPSAERAALPYVSPVSPEEEAATIVTEALRAEYVRGLEAAVKLCEERSVKSARQRRDAERLVPKDKLAVAQAHFDGKELVAGELAGAIRALIPLEAQEETK